MLKAKFIHCGQEVEADVANPTEDGRRIYCVEVGCGFSSLPFVVSADHEQDAIDVLVDSRFGHLVIVEEPDMVWLCPRDGAHKLGEDKVCLICGEEGGEYPDPELYSSEGNYGVVCDLSNVAIYEVKVSPRYFGPGLPEEGTDPEVLYRSYQEDEEVLPYWQSHLAAVKAIRDTLAREICNNCHHWFAPHEWTVPKEEKGGCYRRNKDYEPARVFSTNTCPKFEVAQGRVDKLQEINKYLEEVD